MALGHHPSNKMVAKNGEKAPLVSWEPYFCVLLQDEQTFTAYRSEEMAVRISFHCPFLFASARNQVFCISRQTTRLVLIKKTERWLACDTVYETIVVRIGLGRSMNGARISNRRVAGGPTAGHLSAPDPMTVGRLLIWPF